MNQVRKSKRMNAKLEEWSEYDKTKTKICADGNMEIIF